MAQVPDPHGEQPAFTAGRELSRAAAAVILLHGRGASASDMLGLAAAVDRADLAYVAPQAANGTWYPQRFLAPIAANEPWLSSALARIARVLDGVSARLTHDRVVLVGFSQGACLALEFAARHARRYGGIAGLSGGLIGPDGTPRDYAGSLDGTPVFLGCDVEDFHIPAARVHDTAEVMARMGARVTTRLYSGMGHTVNEDEIAHVRRMLDALAPGP